MLNKLKCFLGFHDWSSMADSIPVKGNTSKKNFINMQQCIRCEKREIRSMSLRFRTKW